MKRTLFWGTLLLCLGLGWLGFTRQGLGTVVLLVDRLLPGSLTAQVDGTLLGSWQLRELRYRGLHAELDLARLSLDWAPADLLQGQVSILRLWVSEVDLRLLGESSRDESLSTMPSLPLDLALHEIVVESLRWQQGQATPVVVDRLVLGVQVPANTPLDPQSLDWTISSQLQVDPGEWLPSWPAAMLSLRLHGEGSPGMLALHGELSTQVPSLDEVTGEFELHHQGPTWELRNLALHSARGSLAVNLQALVDPLNATLSARGSWQSLGWPLDTPTMGSRQGSLQLSGSPAAYTFQVDGDWWHEMLGEGLARANGVGDLLGVELQSLELHRVGEQGVLLSASGSLSHADGHVQFEGHWTGLRWPMDDPPAITGGSGELRLSGYLPVPSLGGQLP